MTKRERAAWSPWMIALSAVAVLAVSVAASAQGPASPHAAGARGQEPYRIGAGDTLQVFVWKEADLTRDVTVRIDGRISLPLLGDVQAAGRTPGELAEDITGQLKRFVGSPVVTVGVGASRSRRFYILGMVAKPGEFPMTGPTTLAQGLALAGGFRDYAKSDQIVVLRAAGDGAQFVAVNYKRLESGRDATQNVLLQPGDTVLVP